MATGNPAAVNVSTEGLLRRNVRYSNLNAIFSALAINMVNPFVGIYALRLGATTVQIGLLSSLPALFSLLCAIPGGRVLDRMRHKQAATFWLVASARAFFVAYALAPLFPRQAAPWFLVLAFGMTNLPATLANVGFQSLIADVLSPRGRARALAYRARLMSLAGIVPLLFTGVLLDRLSYPSGYQLVFALGFATGVAEGLMLLRLVEMPGEAARESVGFEAAAAAPRLRGGAAVPGSGRSELAGGPGRGTGVREVLANREFAGFALAAFTLHLGWTMGGPLFTKYRVEVMGANNTWISIYAVVESLAAVASAVYWARLGERRGNRRVLWWTAMAVAGNVWLLAAVIRLPLGALSAVWAGVFNTGTNLMIFNSLLEIIPSGRRATYFAYYATAVNLSALAGPMLAVAFIGAVGIRTALVIAGLVRVSGGLLFYLGLSRGVTQAPGSGLPALPA